MRIGYGSGSVATGAFGTVPGLMLLPYLTDSLGIAALAAGLIVLLPKAWDVVLNPIAGRISDRTEDPRGPRRPWLLRAGLPLAVAFALIFAAPDMGSRVLEAAWVLVFFLAAATAYAFFQVPYVSMPAEITTSYDERTRLMTWRVVILAFTIMLAGATAPVAGPHIVIPASDDAKVIAQSPDRNYRSSDLQVRSDSRQTFLRFDVRGINGRRITGAVIRLFVTDASAASGTAFQTATEWSEATLTWNTRPAVTGPALGRGGVAEIGAYITYDVGAAPIKDGPLSFVLRMGANNSVQMASTETDVARNPELVLTFAP